MQELSANQKRLASGSYRPEFGRVFPRHDVQIIPFDHGGGVVASSAVLSILS
jgi:hypothetical protein